MFRCSSQAATCPPVYPTRWKLRTVTFSAERLVGNIRICIVFGTTRSIVNQTRVAKALSTQPLKYLICDYENW